MSDLLLLMYIPREDSAQRHYEDWLRDVDNPFFNNVPGIAHYTNWKVTSAADCAIPYTHFDLMFLEETATLEEVWGNPDVEAFAQGWTDDWGRYPDARPEDLYLNYEVYRCTAPKGVRQVPITPTALMVAKAPIPDAPNRLASQVLEPVLGTPRFTHFALETLINTGDFAATSATRPDGAYGCVLGEIVAAPALAPS